MKDELLLSSLFLGFRRLFASLVTWGARRTLPSPNAGAFDVHTGSSLEATPRDPVPPPPSLVLVRNSVVEDFPSSGCSWMLC